MFSAHGTRQRRWQVSPERRGFSVPVGCLGSDPQTPGDCLRQLSGWGGAVAGGGLEILPFFSRCSEKVLTPTFWMVLSPARWRRGNGNSTSGLGPCLSSRRIRDSQGRGRGSEGLRVPLGSSEGLGESSQSCKGKRRRFYALPCSRGKIRHSHLFCETPARVKDGEQGPAGGRPRALPSLRVCPWLTRPRRSSSSCHRGQGEDIAPTRCPRPPSDAFYHGPGGSQLACPLMLGGGGGTMNLCPAADFCGNEPTPRGTSSERPRAGSRFSGSKGVGGGGPRLGSLRPHLQLTFMAAVCTCRMFVSAVVRKCT